MSSVNKNKFRKLVTKYLSNNISDQEADVVDKYYQLFEHEPDKIEQLPAEKVSAIQDRIKTQILEKIKMKERPVTPIFRSMYFRAAAAVVLVSGLAAFLYFFRSESSSQGVAVTEKVTKSADGNNRFFTLPDGTKVVLHGNSSINYDDSFNKKTREVTLVCEAYFDVVHLSSGNGVNQPVPFIIKTGKVLTTVLGTAFNIKAWPDQKEIVVTVARGKVKVQDSNNNTTLLTANKQVTLNTRSKVSAEVKTVKSDILTSWTRTDMIFDAVAFGELAAILSKRYDVKITFKNPEIRNCLITGRFSGAESLDEVFKILSITSNTKYLLTDKELIVDGEKCF